MNKRLFSILAALLVISCAMAGATSSSDWEEVPSDDYSDETLTDALDFGVNFLFDKASEKFGVSNKTVEVTKINSVERKEQTKKIYFKFDIEATNNYDAELNGTFTLEHDVKTEKNKILAWHYDVNYNLKSDDTDDDDDCEYDNTDNEEDDDGYPDGGDDNTDEEEEDDGGYTDEEDDGGYTDGGDENTDNEEEEEEEDDGGYTDGGDDNTDNEEEEEEENDGGYTDASDDDYHQLEPSECDTKFIKQIIQDGIDYVVAKETKKIPQDKYYLAEVVSAWKKHTTKVDYYKFEVKAQNKKGTYKLSLKLNSEWEDDESEVRSYSYNVSWKN